MLDRRSFVQQTAAGLFAATLLQRSRAADPHTIRVGSCSVGGYDNAKLAGLEGFEINAGKAADRLEIADPANLAANKAKMQETGIVTSSIMMGLFNSFPLASDPRGPAWIDQTIDAAAELKAGIILVAFFGKGNLLQDDQIKRADVDVVVSRLKEAAPKAEKKGVILGIENTLPAHENMKILERVGSDAVRVYYDIFNLAGQGYDTPAEIRLLRDRIAIFHFKNGPDYLETGKVKFEPSVAAIKEIGYRGWIVLETSSPSKDKVADARRNAAFVKTLFS